MSEPSPLAKHHEGIFKELSALVKAARECGDTPNDVRAVVGLLVEEALAEERKQNTERFLTESQSCSTCSEGLKHLHPVTDVTGQAG